MGSAATQGGGVGTTGVADWRAERVGSSAVRITVSVPGCQLCVKRLCASLSLRTFSGRSE